MSHLLGRIARKSSRVIFSSEHLQMESQNLYVRHFKILSIQIWIQLRKMEVFVLLGIAEIGHFRQCSGIVEIPQFLIARKRNENERMNERKKEIMNEWKNESKKLTSIFPRHRRDQTFVREPYILRRKPSHQRSIGILIQGKIDNSFITECIRDLDWTLVKVARWLFLCQFWSLLTSATILWVALFT